MNLSFQRSRDSMVENQLRPNKIYDQDILELFLKTSFISFLNFFILLFFLLLISLLSAIESAFLQNA